MLRLEPLIKGSDLVDSHGNISFGAKVALGIAVVVAFPIYLGWVAVLALLLSAVVLWLVSYAIRRTESGDRYSD